MQIATGGTLPSLGNVSGARHDAAAVRPDAPRAAAGELAARKRVPAAGGSDAPAPSRNLPRGSLVDIRA